MDGDDNYESMMNARSWFPIGGPHCAATSEIRDAHPLVRHDVIIRLKGDKIMTTRR
jgi:hypothetical protein